MEKQKQTSRILLTDVFERAAKFLSEKLNTEFGVVADEFYTSRTHVEMWKKSKLSTSGLVIGTWKDRRAALLGETHRLPSAFEILLAYNSVLRPKLKEDAVAVLQNLSRCRSLEELDMKMCLIGV